jgi:diguanylate cyclase (GGDEF)-like protein
MVQHLTIALPQDVENASHSAEDIASISWIDALPIAAALIRPTEHGMFRLHASNAAFVQLSLCPASIDVPVELVRAVEASIASDDGQASFSCVIHRGDMQIEMQGHIQALPPETCAEGLSLLTLIDRTQELRTERNLRLELITDPLTGLPNRTGFAAKLAEHKRQDSGQNHAILLIDLCRFSRINEHIGPSAGDDLVVAVARRLQNYMDNDQVVARTGGDEFGILFPGHLRHDDVRHFAERVKRCFEDPFRIGHLNVSIDCAIGGALCTHIADVPVHGLSHAADHSNDIRHAQIALKRAKRSGMIEVYRPEAPNLCHNRFSMETALREALEEDRLSLQFQPLISLSTGAVAGFEALARWNDRGTAIPPNHFIPVAEDSGLIVALGRWVMGHALSILADWDARNGAPVDCYVSVNVSPIQLLRDDIVDVTRCALDAHGISGERLMVELTESAVVSDPDHALQVLGALKALKVRIAMDDFGTGYSNLAYLQRLPIDVLKIDRSFVDKMEHDREQVAIVRTIQSLAEALNMQTTAEGVETPDQARLLSALGYNFGQGYHYARPMDPDAALEFWRQSLVSPAF